MVSFGEALKICLKTKIFNWHDRAPRSEFWWFILFATIAQYVLALFMLIPFIGVFIYLIGYVYLLWAQFMVSIRRLHDKNRSGWWLILNLVLVAIGSVFLGAVIFIDGLQGGYHDGDTISTILMGIGVIFLLLAFVISIFIFVLMVTVGTVGPNRFGPDPLALARQEEAMRHQFYQQQGMYGQGMGPNGQGMGMGTNGGAWGPQAQGPQGPQGPQGNYGWNPNKGANGGAWGPQGPQGQQAPWGQQPPQGQQGPWNGPQDQAPWGQQPPQGQAPWGQQPPQGQQAPWEQQPPQGQQGYYGPQDQQWHQDPPAPPAPQEQWPAPNGAPSSNIEGDAQFSSPQQDRDQQNPPRN